MLEYPLTITFRRVAIFPQVRATDAKGAIVRHAKQVEDVVGLKSDITVFRDEGEQQLLLAIRPEERVNIFSYTYRITRADGTPVGRLEPESGRNEEGVEDSTIYAGCRIFDDADAEVGMIDWAQKGGRNLLGDIFVSLTRGVPVLGGITSRLATPAWSVTMHGKEMFALKKERAATVRAFMLERHGEPTDREEELALAAVLMLVFYLPDAS